MYDEELVEGLEEILKQQELSAIKDFLVFLWHADGMIDEDEEEYSIYDNNKCLNYVEKFFADKAAFQKEMYELQEKSNNNSGENVYEIFRPCINYVYDKKSFYDILAQKVEETEYSKETSLELLNSINILLQYTNIKKELYESEEEYERIKEYSDELSCDLKEVLYTKISELTNEDFIYLNYEQMDSYYDDLIKERLSKLNEVELYKYLLSLDNIPECVKDRIKELNSPALNNLYACITHSNYNKKGNFIEYINELKIKAIKNAEKNIEAKVKIVDRGDVIEKYAVRNWTEEDLLRYESSEEYKLYIDEISKLNKQEFLLYLISDVNNSRLKKIYEEEKIFEAKIRELSDLDLETVYIMLDHDCTEYPEIWEELQNRKLLVGKKEETDGDTYLEMKDFEESEKRSEKYYEIMEYDYSMGVIQPITNEEYYYKNENVLTKIENSLIKTICELEKKEDFECLKLINKINQTEDIEDYEDALHYEEIFYYANIPSDEELIRLYHQRCKYELLKYLSKRIISMPRAYLSMIDVSNKNGIFNDLIEMCLDNLRTEYILEDNDEIEI